MGYYLVSFIQWQSTWRASRPDGMDVTPSIVWWGLEGKNWVNKSFSWQLQSHSQLQKNKTERKERPFCPCFLLTTFVHAQNELQKWHRVGGVLLKNYSVFNKSDYIHQTWCIIPSCEPEGKSEIRWWMVEGGYGSVGSSL